MNRAAPTTPMTRWRDVRVRLAQKTDWLLRWRRGLRAVRLTVMPCVGTVYEELSVLRRDVASVCRSSYHLEQEIRFCDSRIALLIQYSISAGDAVGKLTAEMLSRVDTLDDQSRRTVRRAAEPLVWRWCRGD